MKMLLRAVAVLVALVLGLLALAGAYLAFVFDPNDYRDRIASEVETRTGRAFAIEGDIGLSLFPWLGVALEDVKLGNAEGFGETPFAAAGEVQVRARLLPLLRSELEVDRIVVRGLALDLQRADDGRTNWDDLIAAGDAETDEAPRPEETDGEAAARALAAFVISGIEIDSARVAWQDRQAGVEHTLTDLNVESGEVRAGSPFPLALNFDFSMSDPAVEGRFELDSTVLLDLDAARAELDGLGLRLDVRGDSVPAGEQRLTLDSDVALDLAESRFYLPGFRLMAADLQGRGELEGRWGDGLKGRGQIEVDDFVPRDVIQTLGGEMPEVADDGVLRHGALSSRFAFSASSLQFEGFRLELDDSTLEGELGIKDFARQALRFDLALDEIDLDRYLPPRDERTAATPGAAAAAIDPELLRGRDIVGRLTIGRLYLGGMAISDVEFEVRGEDDVLELSPLGASLYGGRYAGNIRLDGSEEMLAITLDESLSDVRIGALLRDMTGEEARITGRGNLRARLQARGNEVDAIKQTLSGDAAFSFVDGAVRGINVAQFLREARARLTGQPVPETSEPNQTDFSQLSGTLRITDGVIRNDDLDVRSPLVRVGGDGQANLVSEQIDYRVRASVVATLEGQGGVGLTDLRGITVPIRVSGSFDNPRYALDTERLLSDSVRERGRQELERRLQEQVPDDVRERLQRGLGELFGR